MRNTCTVGIYTNNLIEKHVNEVFEHTFLQNKQFNRPPLRNGPCGEYGVFKK